METALSRIAMQLGAELGAERVRLDPESRICTMFPLAADEIARGVRLAREAGVPTSVGRRPPAALNPGRLHLDTRRLHALIHLDESSLLVHVQAGMRLDLLATRLAVVGMSLGSLPHRSLGRSVGALVGGPRPSEATPRGRFIDLCASIEAVLPDGSLISTKLAPRRAAGPDVAHAIIGARGRTGVITSAWLRTVRRPPRRSFAAWAFRDGDAALVAARRLIELGARPADLALVDGAADLFGPGPGETLFAVALDGAPEVVAAEEALASELCAAARPLTAPAAELFFLRPAPFPVRGELFVAAPALAEAWSMRPRPSILRGLHAAGAAILSPTAESLPAPAMPAPATRAIQAALARALDPAGLLGAPSPGGK